MLEGWLAAGLAPRSVTVIEPRPTDRLQDLAQQGLALNASLPDTPALVLIAVKPQMMSEALPSFAGFGGGGTLFVSVAAGTRITFYEHVLGPGTPVVRAMPNTPAAIGRGITAICGNAAATAAHLALAETLLSSVGQVVRIDGEHQMDAVTAVSGSGPAYVFHLIETLAAAGEAEGLPPDLAMTLAKATVAGAGALAEAASETPAQLRVNVTSPGGTTAAALAVLMDAGSGFPALLPRAVHAAAARGRELGG
jgi:pyrroline-5-carboxylate reductase